MRQLGRYLLGEEIGSGGMGTVYRAKDPMINRDVAIKAISQRKFPRTPREEEQERLLGERLFKEAQAAGSLQHPGIVAVHDVGVEDDPFSERKIHWIAMELVQGKDAEQRNPTSPSEILSILKQAAVALDYAHERGIVHRDVKPSNLLVRDDNIVKLTDFGIAKNLNEVTRTPSGRFGTPPYMSPEQISGAPITGFSDQFSLGVVAHKMLTGDYPFNGDPIAALFNSILHSPPRPAQKGENVDRVLARVMSKSPEGRYPNCRAFVREFELALEAPTAGTTVAKIGRYVLIEEIGVGAMGTVYRAKDPDINREVAIKTIAQGLVPRKPQRDQEEKSLTELLFKEASAAGQLNHPGIVTVYDAGVHDDRSSGRKVYWIAMELVRGTDVEHRRMPIAPKQTIDILKQAAAALDHAHRLGIVHRDVKPSNLLVGGDGIAKLTDFGISKNLNEVSQTPSGKVGTPLYMSPEQISEVELTGRSDQFSLAVVAHKMLTDEHPFEGATIAALFKAILELPPRSSNFGKHVDSVLARAMSKSARKRYETCSVFVEELRVALDPVPLRERPLKWFHHPAYVGIPVFAIATAVLAGSIILKPEPSSEKPSPPPDDVGVGAPPPTAAPPIGKPEAATSGSGKSTKANDVPKPPRGSTAPPSVSAPSNAPLSAQTFFNAVLPDVEVFEKGSKLGETPFRMNLPVGTHQFRAEYKGMSWNIDSKVAVGQQNAVDANCYVKISLQATPGFAEVLLKSGSSRTPSGSLGFTPLSNVELPLGGLLEFKQGSITKSHKITGEETGKVVSIRFK